MRVIDLLLQGKNVTVEGKNGYYYIKDDKILFYDLDKNEILDNFFIQNDILLKEGNEFMIRPFNSNRDNIKKKIAVKVFIDTEELNNFLSSINADDVKDIKMTRCNYTNFYTLIYRKNI